MTSPLEKLPYLFHDAAYKTPIICLDFESKDFPFPAGVTDYEQKDFDKAVVYTVTDYETVPADNGIFLSGNKKAYLTIQDLPEGRYALHANLVTSDPLEPVLALELYNLDTQEIEGDIKDIPILDCFENMQLFTQEIEKAQQAVSSAEDNEVEVSNFNLDAAEQDFYKKVIAYFQELLGEHIKGNDEFWLGFGAAINMVAMPIYAQAYALAEAKPDSEFPLREITVQTSAPVPVLNS